MNFKLWKIGIVVAFFCGLADALGVYVAAETVIWGKVIAFSVIKGLGCAGLYMKSHPVEQLTFGDSENYSMKKIIPLIGIAALLAMAVGCATIPDVWIGAIRSAANTGTQIALREDPGLRADFQAAHDELGLGLETGMLTTEQISSILQRLPVNELKGDTAQIIISAAGPLIDNYLGQVTDLNKAAGVKQVGQALYDGLDQALKVPAKALRSRASLRPPKR